MDNVAGSHEKTGSGAREGEATSGGGPAERDGTDRSSARVLPIPRLQLLVDLLCERGWTVMGPTVTDGAVVHAEIDSIDQAAEAIALRGGGVSEEPVGPVRRAGVSKVPSP